MTIDVLAFGIVREIVSSNSVAVQADDSVITVAALKAHLEAEYPRLKELASYMIAVNGIYAAADTVINNGDEVAVIPPVSGG